jgi:hypothetical protein
MLSITTGGMAGRVVVDMVAVLVFGVSLVCVYVYVKEKV